MWYVFAFHFRWGDETDTTVATKAEAGRNGPVWLLLHGGVSFHLLVSQPCLDFWKCVLFFMCWFFFPSFCYCIHTTHHHRSKAKVRHLRCSRHCLLTHLRKLMHSGGCMCEYTWEKHKNTFQEPCVYGHKVIFQSKNEWGGAGKRRPGGWYEINPVRSHDISRKTRDAQTVDYSTQWQLSHKAALTGSSIDVWWDNNESGHTESCSFISQPDPKWRF